MISKVSLSTYSFVLTIAVIIVLAVGMYVTYGTDKFILLAAIVAVLLIFWSLYAPLSISADEKEIRVHSPIKIHKIPMRQVVEVERFQPTMGSIRICGSGGFAGYWGIFKEGDVGRYTAYFGKSSDCFIIRLDNGDKYVLGCKDPEAMIDCIKSFSR